MSGFLSNFSSSRLRPITSTMLGDYAERVFKPSQELRERVLDRIARSKPVEEEGFHFFALPNDNEEGEGRYKLIKQPVALQFFYYNKLYKVVGERTAGVFELFLDLLYVAIIALFSSGVAESPDAIHILKYVIIFLHAYQIWQDIREIFNGYYTDDLPQRTLVLVVMAFMVVFANNAAKMGEEEDSEFGASFYTAVGSYLILHFILIVNWIFYSCFIPEHAVRMRTMTIPNVISFFLRVGILFVHWRGRVILAVIALAVERLSFFYIYSPWFKSKDLEEFSTAVNIEHEKDRMTALYIIVLGEFLNAVVLKAPAGDGISSRTLRAILVLVIAYTLNWLYVHVESTIRNTHPLRRSAITAMLWFWIHEPLCAVLVLAGDIAAELTQESHLEHHAQALQWIFCGSMSIGLLCLWGLAQCPRETENLLFHKQLRLAGRLVCVPIFACLPLSDLRTSSVLGVVSALLIGTVVWETYGSLYHQTLKCGNGSPVISESSPLDRSPANYNSVDAQS